MEDVTEIQCGQKKKVDSTAQLMVQNQYLHISTKKQVYSGNTCTTVYSTSEKRAYNNMKWLWKPIFPCTFIWTHSHGSVRTVSPVSKSSIQTTQVMCSPSCVNTERTKLALQYYWMLKWTHWCTTIRPLIWQRKTHLELRLKGNNKELSGMEWTVETAKTG